MIEKLNVKKRLKNSIIDMFSHGNNPMKDTFKHKGDSGLFGPGSQTWRIISDVSGFMGGIRALYLQAAHPEVVAGVYQHSNYKKDPFGRLSRTADYVAVTSFGAIPEVNAMIHHVKMMHQRVKGRSTRGISYTGDSPELSSWVHNSLVNSFLVAYQLLGDTPISASDADCFVKEQTLLGQLMGANQLPETADSLSEWIITHPDLEQTHETRAVVPFLNRPPLPVTMLVGYGFLKDAAIGSLPKTVRKILSLRTPNFHQRKGSFFTTFLRKAMGFSPARDVAIERIQLGQPL